LLRRLRLIGAITICAFFTTLAPTLAVPIFAHRYGLACQACHTTVPHLNEFGRSFAVNGFRLPQVARGVFPFAVKVNLAYSSEAEVGLPKAVVDEVELLSGGPIGNAFSYFVEQYVVDGGQPGLLRDAFLQYNRGNKHVRAGQFTLPLPVDPEEQRETLAHYLVFDQTVGENGFNFFQPRVGIDASTITRDFEAHIGIVQSHDQQSGQPASGVDVIGEVAKTFGERTTLYAYRYQGQRRIQTGADSFYRDGYGAGEAFGKLDVIGVLQRGNDRYVPGAAISSGGFVEARYAFSPALKAITRYDRASDALSGVRSATILTLITRPRSNMRFTIEDQITDHHTLSLAWLFAY
jgi:hypothetical protein